MRYARRCEPTREDAEDLFAETRLNAYRAFGSYEGSRPFLNWAIRIMVHEHLDRIRNAKRRVTHVSLEDAGFDTEKVIGECDFIDLGIGNPLLIAMIEMLTPTERLILLASAEGEKPRDIGSAIDLPDGTVRSKLYRTRVKARLILASLS